MRRPCVTYEREIKENGLGRTIKKFSYVAVLTKINDSEVKAVRMDGFERKTDVHKKVEEQFPDWKVKAVHKLYDEDFMEVKE